MFEHPRLSRLLLVVKENEEIVRKFVKNDYETISVNFSQRQKLWPPGVKNAQIFIFHDCRTTFRKTSIISGTTSKCMHGMNQTEAEYSRLARGPKEQV